MFIEINIRKTKWLIRCSYNPYKVNIKNHYKVIGKNLNSQSSKYGNFIVLGDFNAKPTEIAMTDFMEVFNFKSLTKGPTCFKNTNKRTNFFKNPNKPSCMDLILTNRKNNLCHLL